MVDYESNDPAYWDWIESERLAAQSGFHRVDVRATSFKRRCLPGCGHWIDTGEPYRYQVWKGKDDRTITQRLDCEFCAREDNRY